MLRNDRFSENHYQKSEQDNICWMNAQNVITWIHVKKEKVVWHESRDQVITHSKMDVIRWLYIEHEFYFQQDFILCYKSTNKKDIISSQ